MKFEITRTSMDGNPEIEGAVEETVVRGNYVRQGWFLEIDSLSQILELGVRYNASVIVNAISSKLEIYDSYRE